MAEIGNRYESVTELPVLCMVSICPRSRPRIEWLDEGEKRSGSSYVHGIRKASNKGA